jgi:hypothetical protein
MTVCLISSGLFRQNDYHFLLFSSLDYLKFIVLNLFALPQVAIQENEVQSFYLCLKGKYQK